MARLISPRAAVRKAGVWTYVCVYAQMCVCVHATGVCWQVCEMFLCLTPFCKQRVSVCVCYVCPGRTRGCVCVRGWGGGAGLERGDQQGMQGRCTPPLLGMSVRICQYRGKTLQRGEISYGSQFCIFCTDRNYILLEIQVIVLQQMWWSWWLSCGLGSQV